MPITVKDGIVTQISVTDAELLTLLGDEAQRLGLIDYPPTSVEVDRDSDQGWLVSFDGNRTP